MKICNKCNIEKSIDNFQYRNKSKEVRHNICKLCEKIRNKEYYYKIKKKF